MRTVLAALFDRMSEIELLKVTESITRHISETGKEKIVHDIFDSMSMSRQAARYLMLSISKIF